MSEPTPKRPTIYDVAERAGVSTFTVSRVINNSGHVRDVTRAKVERAVEELNYVPSVAAQRLSTQRSDMIGLVISDIVNPFWGALTTGVQVLFGDMGRSVILGNAQSDPAVERAQVEMMVSQGVDGIIIAPYDQDSLKLVDEIAARGIACVMIDRREPVVVDVVRGDNIAGAYELTKLLLDAGHRRIGLVNGRHQSSTAQDRYEGYVRALTEANVSIKDDHVSWGPSSRPVGFEAMKSLLALDEPPTAVFATNNSLANGVIDHLLVRGLRIPQDVSVVGFDSIPTLDSFLTVAVQPAVEMGQTAAELLKERIDGFNGPPRERVLEVEIRQCRSVASPRL